MTTYEWKQIEHPSGYDEEFEVDGKVIPGTIQAADPNSTRFIALVEKGDDEGGTVEDLPEGVDDEGGTSRQSEVTVSDLGPSEQHSEGSEEVDYHCNAETASGRCTRGVDDPDETCWQH